MRLTLLPVPLTAMVLLAGCATSERPCPQVAKFPAELQIKAALELEARPRSSR